MASLGYSGSIYATPCMPEKACGEEMVADRDAIVAFWPLQSRKGPCCSSYSNKIHMGEGCSWQLEFLRVNHVFLGYLLKVQY